MKEYAAQYWKSLYEDVLPFWQKHSLDQEYGGYFTCLDADGHVYDTDKFVWLQARQAWTFSMLYNRLDQRQEWLDIAQSGAEFLLKHGSDDKGNYYFSLTREGQPLIAPYNIFSDCFAAMALGVYGRAANDSIYLDEAKRIYENILKRRSNPKGKYTKAITATRPLKNFALPMILSNLALELDHILTEEELNEITTDCEELILGSFWHEEQGVLLENVSPDGSLSDSFDGRLTNPGHGLEACWFLLDIAERRGDQVLIEKLVDMALKILDFGWDEQHDGIFYFLDIKGHPPQQLEWDQKLWWVHFEALIAMIKGYRLTKNPKCASWFQRLHTYTWERFHDHRGGLEWYGYLNRQGQVLLPLKGGKWKGCFHIPRALFVLAQELESL
ncbi:MAG: AGE family epimerase/isomerase [Bacteroidota bacterium]